MQGAEGPTVAQSKLGTASQGDGQRFQRVVLQVSELGTASKGDGQKSQGAILPVSDHGTQVWGTNIDVPMQEQAL